MKKTQKLVNSLLEELERAPMIQVACEKVGITRNTFYRWAKEDPKLAKRINESISIGTGVVHDVAVSVILNGMQRGDFRCAQYWLDRRHPEFRRPWILKYDADDPINYSRLVNEQGMALRAKTDAIEASQRMDEEKFREKKEKWLAWMKMWTKDQEEFKEWKRNKGKGKNDQFPDPPS